MMTDNEPAFKPDKAENCPDWVWVPNRKERRAMQHKKAQIRASISGKDAMSNGKFKQDVYKDLLENMQKNAPYYKEKYKEEVKEDGNSIDSEN